MRLVRSDGSEWLLREDGSEVPYRFWHRLADAAREYWNSRDWRRRQAAFTHTGTRYYGDGGTIHHSTHVDVETDAAGTVVAVWFRCQPLPFKQARAGETRASEMTRMYQANPGCELHGVEIKDTARGEVF